MNIGKGEEIVVDYELDRYVNGLIVFNIMFMAQIVKNKLFKYLFRLPKIVALLSEI